MDDLQIKPASPAPGNPAGANPGPTASQPAAAQAAAPNPQQQRGYNLVADVEASEQAVLQPEKFIIPKFVQQNYPDLIELIKNTESMDDEERQYWFQILPIMSAEQVQKLKNILISEKDQLQSLDQEYEQELQKLNEKHLIEWKEFESKEKVKAIQEAESKSEEQEKKTEEELLAKLSDV